MTQTVARHALNQGAPNVISKATISQYRLAFLLPVACVFLASVIGLSFAAGLIIGDRGILVPIELNEVSK
jgi:hypothetical protein